MDEIEKTLKRPVSRRELHRQWRTDGERYDNRISAWAAFGGGLLPALATEVITYLSNGGVLLHARDLSGSIVGTIMVDCMVAVGGVMFSVMFGSARKRLHAGRQEDLDRWGVSTVKELKRAKRIAMLEEVEKLDLVKLAHEREQKELEEKLACERAEAERRSRHEYERQTFAARAVAHLKQ